MGGCTAGGATRLAIRGLGVAWVEGLDVDVVHGGRGLSVVEGVVEAEPGVDCPDVRVPAGRVGCGGAKAAITQWVVDR